MKAFRGLLIKDFYIAKYHIYTSYILIILAMFGSVIFANFIHEPMVMIGFTSILMVAHFAVAPFAIFTFLRKEGKTQLWLYNPQPSILLLTSKITVTLIYQIISQLLLIIFSLIVLNALDITEIGLSTILLLHLAILAMAMYYMCWIIFYWCFYHSLGKFPSIAKLRWLIIVFTFFLINTIETLLLKFQPFKEFIYKWTVSLPSDQQFSYQDGTWSMNLHDVDLPLIPVFLYILVGVSLLIISNWLLDKKVEV